MRALVTGSSGFAGSHVVETFENAGCNVVGFDAKHGHVWGDVPPVDVVVSLAASANPREALRDPAAAYANSTRIMVETLEYAREVGARVLHVSTNEVYGARFGLPYEPRGPYAGSKACQEIVCETCRDVPVTVVVTQSLFGERQQPDKLVPTVVRNLLAGAPVTLQRAIPRWASRPFLHVRNLAEALLWLSARDPGRRVHVGAERTYSVYDAAGAVAEALDLPLLVEPVDAGGRAGHEVDVETIGCDLDGWRPQYEAMDALRDVARWYRDNPEWLEPPDALSDSDPAHSAPTQESRRAA